MDRDGWYRIAWGFINPITPVNSQQSQEDPGYYQWRLDQEMQRVQLYAYNTMPTYQVEHSPDVWQHWNSGYREKFVSTLYIKLGCTARVVPTKVVVDNIRERTILHAPTEQEVLYTSVYTTSVYIYICISGREPSSTHLITHKG